MITVNDFLLFYAKHGFIKPLKKSCYRKFCRRSAGRSFYVKTRYGVSMKVILGDNVENYIYFHEDFEPGASDLMIHFAKHSDCFIDIGCNIGYFSCLFGAFNPNAKIYSIDPNPQMIERTTENMKLNEIRNFQTFNCGVSSEDNQLDFYIPQRKNCRGSFIKPEKYAGDIQTIHVPVRLLMNILHPEEVSNAVMKIDAEGYEGKILSGLSPSDMHRFNYILFEFATENMPNGEESEADLLKIPWFQDYSMYAVQTDGPLQPFSYTRGVRYSMGICLVRKGAPWPLDA